MSEKTKFAHVVATFDRTNESADILYVNPSNVSSEPAPTEGRTRGDVSLLLRDKQGEPVAQIHPEVRYDSCSGESAAVGLIQQDVQLVEGATSLELVFDGRVLDTFNITAEEDDIDPMGGMVLDGSLDGADNRRGFAGPASEREGVTYAVLAKPNNSEIWNTLSVGRRTPEFEIDKNQFPGAEKLEIKVVQNVGFSRRVIDERVVSLA